MTSFVLKKVFVLVVLIAGQASLRADSSKAPAIQWVKTVSGSGANVASGVATDSHGNLYITGNTTSLDFPTVAAVQRNAGGSPLIRINPATKSSQKLYSPGLAALQSIIVDPKNQNIIYGISATTLVRSTDGGNSWKGLPEVPGVTALYSVVVDPTNDNILYLGTSPLGAFKSTDAGASWTAINNGVPPNSNLTGDPFGFDIRVNSLDVYQIWIDPKLPSLLFAYSGRALLRSNNAGGTWTALHVQFFFSGHLTFDPLSPGVIYASGFTNLGTDTYKSTGYGQTWMPLPRLPDGLPPDPIVPDPFHQGTLYASSDSGLNQSKDSGLTWTLKINGKAPLIAADPNKPVLYANPPGLGIIESADGFSSYSTIVPAESALAQIQVSQIQVAGSNLFLVTPPTTDIFISKLDPNGNVVYSTYFGGTGADTAAGIAVDKDGSVYVTGSTNSTDFAVTKGAFATTLPAPIVVDPLGALSSESFVLKLNPDGSLAWSTYFADPRTTTNAIAVDADGNPYVAGWTYGGLPTTPGVYQTQFQYVFNCPPGSIVICPSGPSSAFLTKLNSQGSGLVFSTYIAEDSQQNVLYNAAPIALAQNGNVYLVSSLGIYSMNATGSALLRSNTSLLTANLMGPINSVALDASGNLYATGFSPGLVLKFDSTLSKVLASIQLDGQAESVAIDSSGNVIVSGNTDSKSFPLHAPFQGSFSPRSGFVAGLDSSLTHLLFSTYLGDTRPFVVVGALPDGHGNVLVVGSTLTATGGDIVSGPGFAFSNPVGVIANKIALPPAPTVRLDSVVNFASQLGVPLSPGEAIAAIGSGFGPDAKLLFDGKPLPAVSQSANRIVAVVPSDEKTSGAVQVTVSSNGVTSNPVYMPTAVTSPGIYSTDGSGVGQGYILNKDGSRNSQANPAAVGSAITIFATGVGHSSEVGPFAVTDLPVAVFVDEFYASGIAAVMKQAPGLPGDVYELGVYVPDPAKFASQNPQLAGFTMPPQVPVVMFVGPARSQEGIMLWVKQP